ncbi:MAG TPA: ABC transporter permease [Symbiobacteriaceae bacterium]|nr:ABC transporter permease [Symbiobacteriaceae bacterium]
MTGEIALSTVIITTLTATVVAGTTILFAALGEVLSERAGILNLGVEGMMLAGTCIGYIAALKTGSPWAGVLAAALIGAALAGIHAVLTVTLRANQVVSGLALTIFGTGFSSYIGKAIVGIPLPQPFVKVAIPGLAQIPYLGQILFNQNPLVYLSYVLVPALWYWLYKTRPGLNLRAVGENPGAADAAGVNVFLTRYAYVMIGGALSGIAGAHLSLAVAPSWVEGMTQGRGWVAVALVIFATWNPGKAIVGAYLFGGVEALTFRLQAMGSTISVYFLGMLPYLFTIAVLLMATSRARKGRLEFPAALGTAYDRETR